jgi:hypothetical protein
MPKVQICVERQTQIQMKRIRIWVEKADGLSKQTGGSYRSFGRGLVYKDVTDSPCPCIMAGRPIKYIVTVEGSDKADSHDMD